MLKLNNIEVTYLNVIRVLHGVSMDVEDGWIIALLGANGAGKFRGQENSDSGVRPSFLGFST